MQTEQLYAFDSYLKECTTAVVAVAGSEVALSETVFYPGGGGQPCDTGSLEAAGHTWTVTGVRKDEQYVWHTLAGEELPAVSSGVRGTLDWERRYLLMRTHTALHMLSAIAFADYGASVTGGNMDLAKDGLTSRFRTFRRNSRRRWSASSIVRSRKLGQSRYISCRVWKLLPCPI